jgi:hypothetical protein
MFESIYIHIAVLLHNVKRYLNIYRPKGQLMINWIMKMSVSLENHLSLPFVKRFTQRGKRVVRLYIVIYIHSL